MNLSETGKRTKPELCTPHIKLNLKLGSLATVWYSNLETSDCNCSSSIILANCNAARSDEGETDKPSGIDSAHSKKSY